MADEEGILATGGAQWFVDLLRRVPGLRIDEELCQEDWGVVMFATRNQRKFWIGLSLWPEGEHAWLAHFHHGSWAWLQRFSVSGKNELRHLVSDVHDLLASEPKASEIMWYEDRQMREPQADGNPNPSEDWN